jgi:two-component system, chemotaxis family, response regulator Rcp1
MKRALEILLVEDNPGDVFLFSRALEEEGVPACRLQTAPNGKEAVELLRRLGSHGDAVRPDLIVLDLNLPLMTGREVLKEVKADPALLDIPIVVFSSSSDPRDVRQCYHLHANAYMVKAPAADRFRDNVVALIRFWSQTALLPGDWS